jgi:hypothetical protein
LFQHLQDPFQGAADVESLLDRVSLLGIEAEEQMGKGMAHSLDAADILFRRMRNPWRARSRATSTVSLTGNRLRVIEV